MADVYGRCFYRLTLLLDWIPVASGVLYIDLPVSPVRLGQCCVSYDSYKQESFLIVAVNLCVIDNVIVQLKM